MPASLVEEYVAVTSGVIKGDMVSIFIPYIVYLIDQNNYDSLDNCEKIASDFFDHYKFSLDPLVFRSLVTYILQQEYVYRDSHNIFTSNTQKIKSHKFDELYKKAISGYTNLKVKCKSFLVSKLSMDEPSDVELDNAVYGLIQSIGTSAVPFAQDNSVQDTNSAYAAALNDFVLFAEKEDPEIVDELNMLAVSDILWRVISSGNQQDMFFRNGAKVFLDTRFVFRLMGLEGEYWERQTKYLVNQITENGGEVILFKHVKDEVERIIRNAQSMYQSDNFDISKASRVAKEFYSHREKYTKSYISDILYSLLYDSKQTYGFSIEAHDYEEETNQFQVDYQKLKSNVISEYKISNPNFSESDSDDSIEVDVRSITMCYRARGSFTTDRVDDITVLFLTTNTAILRAAQKAEHTSISSHQIPIGMTAEYLSSFLALENKIDYLQTNRVMMLAYCYGAIQPTKAEIRAFIKALDTETRKTHISKDRVRYLKENQVYVRLYTLNSYLPTEKQKSIEELEHAKANEYRERARVLESENHKKDAQIEQLENTLCELEGEKSKDELNRAHETAAAISFADSFIKRFTSVTTILLGLFTSLLPFVLDRLFPVIKWKPFVLFWGQTQSHINLILFFLGTFVFLVGLILKIKKVQKKLKNFLVHLHLFRQQIKNNDLQIV